MAREIRCRCGWLTLKVACTPPPTSPDPRSGPTIEVLILSYSFLESRPQNACQTAPGWESGPQFSSQLHQMAALGADTSRPQLTSSSLVVSQEEVLLHVRAFCRESFVTAKEQGHWDCSKHRLIY